MIHPNNAVILPNYQVKKVEIKRQGKSLPLRAIKKHSPYTLASFVKNYGSAFTPKRNKNCVRETTFKTFKSGKNQIFLFKVISSFEL